MKNHGLSSAAEIIITSIEGFKDRRIIGDTGDIVPSRREQSLGHCLACTNKALVHWGSGKSVTAKEWNKGSCSNHPLETWRLSCLYAEVMKHIASGYGINDDAAPYDRMGRRALVVVSVIDITKVEEKKAFAEGASFHVLGFQIVELVDSLRLAISADMTTAISEQSKDWHRRFHRAVDASQPESWKEFVDKLTRVLISLGISQ